MNDPDRVTWGDSRIGATFAEISRELEKLRGIPDRVQALIDEQRAMRDIPTRLAEVVVEFRELRKDVAACFDANRETNQKLDEAERRRREREVEQRKERKSDRHWMIGAALSAAGLVIAALALLADKL